MLPQRRLSPDAVKPIGTFGSCSILDISFEASGSGIKPGLMLQHSDISGQQ